MTRLLHRLVVLAVLLPSVALAQQPAQPVLPVTQPPAGVVREMSPCLPELDSRLKLHLQPCKRFHADSPPPDWVDRMVVAVTARAGALAWSDLDSLEQAEVLRHAPQVPRTPLPLSEDEFVGSREAFKAWAAQLSQPPPPGTPGNNGTGHTDVGPDATAPLGPDKRLVLPPTKALPVEVIGSVAFAPQAAGGENGPSRRAGPEGDPSDRRIAAAEGLAPQAAGEERSASALPLTAPLVYSFTARVGDLVEVVVPRVKAAPGWLWPDPVLWLLRVDETGDPEKGIVVAAADDGPGGLPTLAWTSDRDCRLRLVVAPWSPRTAGMISLTVLVAGETVVETRSAFFGGRALHAGHLRPGDRVFAGAVPGGDAAETPGEVQGPEMALDHDGILWLLPAPWAALPAPYQASNNAMGTLPALRIAQDVPDAFLVAGAFLPDSSPRLRLFVSKNAPRSEEAAAEADGIDADGDGLSAAVEAVLGTCDSQVQAAEGLCRAPVPLPSGWNPRDTDNDGLADREEVLGVRRCFSAAPEAPYNELPDCLRGEDRLCLDECPADTAMAAVLPLSALGADPTVYDVYLEWDYWQPSNERAALHSIPPQERTAIRRAFEQAYTHEPAPEAPGGRFVPPPYPFRFHLFQDDPIAIPDATRMAHIPALGHRSLAFDLFFSPDRKYTNTFHYMVGINRGGGQTDVSGRASVIGATGKGGLSVKFIHETGHLLGLLHNYRASSPDNSAFYLSEMSYGYSHTMPPPMVWDGVFAPCGASKPCGPGFRCALFQGHGRLCAPDCGIQDEGTDSGRHFVRFSSGELPLVGSESGTMPETGYPRWYLPYLYCYTAAGRGTSLEDRLARFSSPACEASHCVRCNGDSCDVDWDQDGRYTGATSLDVDRDGKLNPEPTADGNDWLRMLERGRLGLSVTSKKTVPAYYSGFTASAAGNLMPYPSVVHERHGGYVTDLTNVCDEVAKWPHCRDQRRGEAAIFRGPASGDAAIEVRLPSAWCADLRQGLSVTLRAKPFVLPPEDAPAVLFDSTALKILLYGDGDTARWVARITNADGGTTELEVEDRRAVGQWSRLTVMVYNGSGRGVLRVRRGITHLFDEEGQTRVAGRVCVLSVGAEAGAASSFTGLLDDPMVLSGPVREL